MIIDHYWFKIYFRCNISWREWFPKDISPKVWSFHQGAKVIEWCPEKWANWLDKWLWEDLVWVFSVVLAAKKCHCLQRKHRVSRRITNDRIHWDSKDRLFGHTRKWSLKKLSQGLPKEPKAILIRSNSDKLFGNSKLKFHRLCFHDNLNANSLLDRHYLTQSTYKKFQQLLSVLFYGLIRFISWKPTV